MRHRRYQQDQRHHRDRRPGEGTRPGPSGPGTDDDQQANRQLRAGQLRDSHARQVVAAELYPAGGGRKQTHQKEKHSHDLEDSGLCRTFGAAMIRSHYTREYWKKNLTYVAVLLAIWFAVSYGFGILLVEPLNRIRIGGFQLGFWFAQQGSIYVFVVLIFVYVRLMNRLDRRFEVDEREDAG